MTKIPPVTKRRGKELMKLCRFAGRDARPRLGLLLDDPATVIDVSSAGFFFLCELLDHPRLPALLRGLARQPGVIRHPLSELSLLPPIDEQEVWAAGVTYERSKTARMAESDFSATAYDLAYEAERPELFFKSLPEKVVGPGDRVGIRRDARWNVPEPELALVFNSRRQLVGVTIGNDMSSRDIEGENLRYLPQAKVYDRACALGPWIAVGATEKAIRSWTISLEIRRQGTVEFHGETPVARITRTFNSLGEWLFRSQTFAHGAVLLTGTGIVPPDNFSLKANDEVAIAISGIGLLSNPVAVV